jgi:hypothetical protein
MDAYPSPQGMAVWLMDRDCKSCFVQDSFHPSFYIHGPRPALHDLCRWIRAARLPVRLRRAERHDLFLRRELELLEVVVPDPTRWPGVVRSLRRAHPALTFYNCTVPLPQLYFYERGVFPLAQVDVETDGQGRVRALDLRDSPWELDYDLPPFQTMTLRLEGEAGNPNHDLRIRPLEIGVEGTTRTLLVDDPRELLMRIRELL